MLRHDNLLLGLRVTACAQYLTVNQYPTVKRSRRGAFRWTASPPGQWDAARLDRGVEDGFL